MSTGHQSYYSEAVTEGIRIYVESQYVPGRSSEASRLYFFIYHVTIENCGDRSSTLLNRHWVITNGEGEIKEVRGPGVIGQTPYLKPGERFSYTSACPLNTPVGSMRGSYEMLRDDGETFWAEIKTFTLAMPYAIN